MDEKWQDFYKAFLGEKKVNLGCANNHEPGFINVDKNPDVKPQVLADLERPPLPFEDNSVDTVMGSHIFEHIRNFIPLVEDIHRILKPGGFLISFTPYGSSDDNWENPHHVRGFTEMTWEYFDQRIYGRNDAGNGATEGYKGDFEVVQTVIVPNKEFWGDPAFEWKKRHLRNIVKEIQVVLRKKDGSATV